MDVFDLPECPEYWENPKDICAAAYRHGIFCYCTALTNTNFGMKHCTFYKTKEQLRREEYEIEHKKGERQCKQKSNYLCPQLIFKIPKH